MLKQLEARPRESREDRKEFTKRAIAEIMRTRLGSRSLRQTTVVRKSGISRSHLRALLRGEKEMSLFIFLELSDALGFDDPCQFLRDVINRREQLISSCISDESDG